MDRSEFSWTFRLVFGRFCDELAVGAALSSWVLQYPLIWTEAHARFSITSLELVKRQPNRSENNNQVTYTFDCDILCSTDKWFEKVMKTSTVSPHRNTADWLRSSFALISIISCCYWRRWSEVKAEILFLIRQILHLESAQSFSGNDFWVVMIFFIEGLCTTFRFLRSLRSRQNFLDNTRITWTFCKYPREVANWKVFYSIIWHQMFSWDQRIRDKSRAKSIVFDYNF